MKTPQPPPPVVSRYLQENELSQEDEDLISSLPTEKGWVANYLHKYQGFWQATTHMQGALACQKHFQALESDILLVTTPKSGTTWLKAILFALVKREHYLDPQRHPLLTENPHVLVPFLEIDVYTDIQLFTCVEILKMRLFHFGTSQTNYDPFGTYSLDDAFDKFCRGVSVSGPFWDHVLGFWKESLKRPESAIFIKFEEMKEEPALHLRRLAKFLGCPFSPEEETHGVVDGILRLCSFENLSNLDVNKSGILSSGMENNAFFRKGEVGDWMDYLTTEMVKKPDSITQEKFHGSGLKRVYSIENLRDFSGFINSWIFMEFN
ncbi:unnamed protein product [Malus baccata var. baccata]